MSSLRNRSCAVKRFKTCDKGYSGCVVMQNERTVGSAERERHVCADLVNAVRPAISLKVPLKAQEERVDKRTEGEQRLGFRRAWDGALGRSRNRIVRLPVNDGSAPSRHKAGSQRTDVPE